MNTFSKNIQVCAFVWLFLSFVPCLFFPSLFPRFLLSFQIYARINNRPPTRSFHLVSKSHDRVIMGKYISVLHFLFCPSYLPPLRNKIFIFLKIKCKISRAINKNSSIVRWRWWRQQRLQKKPNTKKESQKYQRWMNLTCNKLDGV